MKVPTLTYKEFVESKKNSGLIIKEDAEDFYEDEDEEINSETGQIIKDSEVGLVQFRQISTSGDISCGITLLGANIICWGTSSQFRGNFLPRQMQGPFKQVSAGDWGVCAITADPQEIMAEDHELNVDHSIDASKPDQLKCWGFPSFTLDPHRFEAWDQISVGSTYACGVSMESEIDCFGAHVPMQALSQFKDLIIA